MQAYIKTDQQMHWLSQLIAKVNKAFVPEKADDSHTNLYFDPVAAKLLGRWISSGQEKFIFGFNLNTFNFEWINSQMQVQKSITVFGKVLPELESEVAEAAGKLSLDKNAMIGKLHFEIPDYQINSLQAGDISAAGLSAWVYYRDIANLASQRMLGWLQSESEVRIWPHHFDTGIYAQITGDPGIGFGLAMEDSMAGEPYFYLAGYSSKKAITYESLPDLSPGYWELGENWKGAILPIGKLPANDLQKALSTLDDFFKNASAWYVKSTGAESI